MDKNMDQQLIQVFLNLEKFITKKSPYWYLSYIRYNNELKRCEAFDNYGVLKIYPIDFNTSSFLFTYDRKAKELKKEIDSIFFPTSMFKFSTQVPVILEYKSAKKQALDNLKKNKNKMINIQTGIKVKKTIMKKILKDIEIDSLVIKKNNNIIIINDRYFIHADVSN